MDSAIFILLLFFGCHLSRGQDRVDASGTVLLRLPFNPYFNYYEKLCCKFYQGVCLPFVDNRGYAGDIYKGRISLIEYNGGMDVTIRNLQKSDSGLYRCAITDSQYHVYKDFIVVIPDSANRQSPPLPSLTTTSRTTVATVTTSATPVESLSDVQGNASSRFKTDLWITLAAVLGALMMLILIISVTTIVVHRRKKDEKKSGTAPCDRPSSFRTGSTSEDVNSIVYTTVNFQPREDHAGLYANCKVHKSPAASALQPYGRPDSTDSVEYSTLAVRQ
ncbi:uncharacterized protein LOC135234928 isoform X11 [Anguilla rostrata]|uniref:uncharacterized protein LOC135234928 isoform X11 n=1 Tax=Anguilla rostrata TaxID=7938 RepID=UPI0030D5DE84